MSVKEMLKNFFGLNYDEEIVEEDSSSDYEDVVEKVYPFEFEVGDKVEYIFHATGNIKAKFLDHLNTPQYVFQYDLFPNVFVIVDEIELKTLKVESEV